LLLPSLLKLDKLIIIVPLLIVEMCNIVEKLLMLKIGTLNLFIFSKSGSGIRYHESCSAIWQTTSGNMQHPESGKFDIQYIPSGNGIKRTESQYEKIKLMVIGKESIQEDVKSGRCCGKGVVVNSILCIECNKWCHLRCSGLK